MQNFASVGINRNEHEKEQTVKDSSSWLLCRFLVVSRAIKLPLFPSDVNYIFDIQAFLIYSPLCRFQFLLTEM